MFDAADGPTTPAAKRHADENILAALRLQIRSQTAAPKGVMLTQ